MRALNDTKDLETLIGYKSIGARFRNSLKRAKDKFMEKPGLYIGVIATKLAILATFATGCTAAEVNVQDEVNNVTPVEETVETYQEPEEEVIVEERSPLEKQLEGIIDENLRANIENEIQNSYFKTDEEKINYVIEVSRLNDLGVKTDYLFNDVMLDFNPDKKTAYLNAFHEMDWDDLLITSFFKERAKYENKIDADEDGFPDDVEMGIVKKYDTRSSIFDPLDTPEHRAKFNVILMSTLVKSLDGGLVDDANKDIIEYYLLVKDNPNLEDLIIVNSEDLGLDMPKGEFLIKPSYSTLLNKIENLQEVDYFLVLMELPTDNHTPQDIYFYYFENTYSEGKLLTLLEAIKGKCKEGFSHGISCNIGNLSTLPKSGLIIGYATESGIPFVFSPSQEFPKIVNEDLFIDMTEAFNKSIQFHPGGRIPGDTYDLMAGLQYCAKKQEDGTIKYWNSNGVFKFLKDSKGNYDREETGEIKKEYFKDILPNKVAPFLVDDLFN